MDGALSGKNKDFALNVMKKKKYILRVEYLGSILLLLPEMMKKAMTYLTVNKFVNKLEYE